MTQDFCQLYTSFLLHDSRQEPPSKLLLSIFVKITTNTSLIQTVAWIQALLAIWDNILSNDGLI